MWQAVFRVANVSMGIMFKFISSLLLKIYDISQSKDIQVLYELFPDTLTKAQAIQPLDNNNFKKYIVCKKCHSTYEESDCIVTGNQIPQCSFIRFPRHPQQRMRKPCNKFLLKPVKTASGKKIFSPLKVYCYNSVINSIEAFMQQPGVIETFNQWKNVYDGAIWKSFLSKNGEELLANRYSLGLLMNIDWFQPFKHLIYS